MRRSPRALALVAVPLLAATAGRAPGAPADAGASARASAIRIVVPAGEGAGTEEIAAPTDAVQYAGGFAYPQDGSIVLAGPVTASVTASSGAHTAASSASSEVSSISLFGGEVQVERATGRSVAAATAGDAGGSTRGSRVVGLAVGGVPVHSPAGQVQLGDWGYADVLVEGSAPGEDGHRGYVTALDVHLTADHGGLPAGSEILVGHAEASARAAPPPAPRVPPVVRKPLPSLVPKLTGKGYVFPVHGPASFVDTFGAGRADVGWHHGEDVFAPLGAPVLAVSAGTVVAVGWNAVGGNRVWLRDRDGNRFYYAHLSAFSPLAVDGARVEAGDVLGFLGNTGDAEATPPHLHFEVHPVGLLSLGYDGVVNPYPYLQAWERLEDVRFIAGAAWLPSLAHASSAPRPGAYVLSSTDISRAGSLRPGELTRVLDARLSAAAS